MTCAVITFPPKIPPKSRSDKVKGTTTSATAFLPITREELLLGVEECLELSAAGQCSTGPHGPIGEWDVSRVTDMYWMFNGAVMFDQDLSNWDVDKVTTMGRMFYGAESFNGDLYKWNVGKVTSMVAMFRDASAFNQDLSRWNVVQVRDMYMMFRGATSFNQDLSKWNVGQVADMCMMFRGATSFRQVLCGEAWIISLAEREDMFMDSPGSIANRVCPSSQSSFQPQNKADLKAAIDSCPSVKNLLYGDKTQVNPNTN